MNTRRAAGWILIFALLTFAGAGGLGLVNRHHDQLPAAGSTTAAEVTRVVDGDTVQAELASGDRVTIRYIGVDTPETVKPGTPVQCFGKAASAFNRRLMEGKQVRLRIGRERLDRYGRLLAYVYLEDARAIFVNALLVRRGYARTLAIPPNTNFARRFAALERNAERQGVGLWRACR